MADGLLIGIDVNFRDQRFQQFVLFSVAHDGVEFIEIGENPVDVVAGDLVCLDGLLLGFALNQGRFGLLNPIISIDEK